MSNLLRRNPYVPVSTVFVVRLRRPQLPNKQREEETLLVQIVHPLGKSVRMQSENLITKNKRPHGPSVSSQLRHSPPHFTHHSHWAATPIPSIFFLTAFFPSGPILSPRTVSLTCMRSPTVCTCTLGEETPIQVRLSSEGLASGCTK